MAYEFVCKVNTRVAAKGQPPNDPKAIDNAIRDLQSEDPFYRQWKHATLLRKYYKYRNSLPPEGFEPTTDAPAPVIEQAAPIAAALRAPATIETIPLFVGEPSLIAKLHGTHLLRIQKWGASSGMSIDEARLFLNAWIEAAGPYRLGPLNTLFERENQKRASGKPKIEWLRKELKRTQDKPGYWPAERADLTAATRAKCDTLIAAIRTAGKPQSLAELSRATGFSFFMAQDFAALLVNLGELTRTGEDVFALREWGLPRYLSTAELVIITLLAAPHYAMQRGQLKIATGRSHINTVIDTLRKNGILDPAEPSRRGPVKLSAATVAKIAGGKPVCDRRGAIIYWPDLARSTEGAA
jgi:hypothetical protein